MVINGRFTIQTLGGYRMVTVSGQALADDAAGDRMAEAHGGTAFPKGQLGDLCRA